LVDLELMRLTSSSSKIYSHISTFAVIPSTTQHMQTIFTCDLATIDTRSYPKVFVKVNDVDPNINQVTEFLDLWDSMLAANEGPIVAIADGTMITWINGTAIRSLGSGIKRIEKKYKARHRLVITVVPNNTVDILLRAFNAVSELKTQHKMVKSMEDAIAMADREVALSAFNRMLE